MRPITQRIYAVFRYVKMSDGANYLLANYERLDSFLNIIINK